jgi:DNA polymerase III subunit epsilon
MKLVRPLVILDLEATGLDISQDRIIEVGMIKRFPDGKQEVFSRMVNPTIPISEEAIAITGITNDQVKNEPIFADIAQHIVDFIGDADIGGYNSNKFDIPMLVEEFLRTETVFKINDRFIIDVQNIFHKMEQRTLSAAFQFYCGKKMENAHRATYDAEVTMDVFVAQTERYEELPKTMKELAEFTRYGNQELADFAGRLGKNQHGEVTYNFGKHKGKTVAEVDKSEPGYYGWMCDADFPLYTKQVLKEEMSRLKEFKRMVSSNDVKSTEKAKNRPKIDRQATENQFLSMEDKLKALQSKFGK